MTHPTVHLNGTSARDLRDAYEAAYRAVNDALAVLAQARPNGRDYYPQGPTAISRATDEHQSREQRLSDVADELLALALALD